MKNSKKYLFVTIILLVVITLFVLRVITVKDLLVEAIKTLIVDNFLKFSIFNKKLKTFERQRRSSPIYVLTKKLRQKEIQRPFQQIFIVMKGGGVESPLSRTLSLRLYASIFRFMTFCFLKKTSLRLQLLCIMPKTHSFAI